VHILLTDVLTCPRCGPETGLIVRSDVLKDRRVVEGALGCPQCETHYPIRGGIALLGPPQTVVEPAAVIDDEQASIRMAALLGATEPLGFLLVLGPAAAASVPLARMVDNTEIIADVTSAPSASNDTVSRMTFGERLPFYSGRLRGIWLSGDAADRLLEEAARVLHPMGRLVLEPYPTDAEQRLETAGLRVVAQQDETMLAVRGRDPQIASGNKRSLS
jgi:uncharacterized protein YbaR (Trm112 family)